MARPQTTDFLQAFRFHVRVEETSQIRPEQLQFRPSPNANQPAGGEAGFQSVTLPEASVEPAEYREGTYKYLRKFPGPQTYSDATFMRGATISDTVFFDWVKQVWNGGEYRADLTVLHFHRDDVADLGTKIPAASRTYALYECLPIRCKPGADFDATSGEVSLMELDVACEYMEVNPGENRIG